MASRETTIYTCDRCGKELDVEYGYPKFWKTVLVDEINGYSWDDSAAKELCEDCAKEFVNWFNDFMGDKSCSNCAMSVRLDSDAISCTAEDYDIDGLTCFIPREEE